MISPKAIIAITAFGLTSGCSGVRQGARTDTDSSSRLTITDGSPFLSVPPAAYVDLNDAENYIDNREVISIASQLLLAAAIFQISDSIQVVVLGALRGLQDVLIPTLITFIAYWAIGFPISYLLGKEEAYGSFGIWLGLLAGLSSAAVLLYIRFNYLTLKLIKKKHHEFT